MTEATQGEWVERILEIVHQLTPTGQEIFLAGMQGAFVLKTISVEEMERRSHELIKRSNAGETITAADLETLRTP